MPSITDATIDERLEQLEEFVYGDLGLKIPDAHSAGLGTSDNPIDPLRAKRAVAERVDHKNFRAINPADHADVGEAINSTLTELGTDATIRVPPGSYETSRTVSTQAAGQTIEAWGAEIKLADSSDVTLAEVNHVDCEVLGGVWNFNAGNQNLGNIARDYAIVWLANRGGAFGATAKNARLGIGAVNRKDVRLVGLTGEQDADGSGDDNIANFNGCENCSVVGATGTFTDTGVRVYESTGCLATGTVRSDDGLVGFDVGGLMNSYIAGTVLGDPADVGDNGLISEPSGGIDPEGNRYDIVARGVSGRGLRMTDERDTMVNLVADGRKLDDLTTNLMTRGISVLDTNRSVDGNVIKAIIAHTTSADGASLRQGDSKAVLALNDINGSAFKAQSGWDVEVVSKRSTGEAIVFSGATAYAGDRLTGSTDANGQVTFDWSGDWRFGDKPLLDLNTDGDHHFSLTWSTDGNSRYDGVTVTVKDTGGTAVGSGTGVRAKLLGS